MTTLSVPLTKELEARLEELVKSGVGPNKASVMRKALEKLAEDEAVNKVLQAEQELAEGKGLEGDLMELVRKIS